MNTIGSHPGAILFRLAIMVTLILIIMLVFLARIDDAEKGIERASVLQTRKIIDSSLALAFSSYAVNHRLTELAELDGGNPFLVLEQYSMLPAAYVGEIGYDPMADMEPGWYYLRHRRLVYYKAFFDDLDSYFRIALNYSDDDGSGAFEMARDRFLGLRFEKVLDIRT